MLMKPYIRLFAVLTSVALLQGCWALAGGAVVSSVVITQDRRSAGTVIDDNVLELNINDRIAQDDLLRNKVRISVTAMNGVVLLTGEAPTRATRNDVLQHARSAKQVRQIVNEIRIAPTAGISTISNDSWITSKVKTKLVTGKGLTDATRINVHTANGVVYLMGLVTHSEADAATEIARTVSGAKKVVRLFEYVD
jgi:osmotically-inducible protein OsmY